jgi:hypothetical protein
MKSVSRFVDVVTFLIFLIALASNCVSATRTTLDSLSTSVPVLTQLNSVNADQLDSLIADDASDGTPTLLLIHSAIALVDSVPSPTIFTAVSVVGVKVQQPTVLRI